MHPPLNRDQSPANIARRFRRAIEMHEEGVAITRARLQRENPDASPEHIAKLLGAWMRSGSHADSRYLIPAPCPRFSAESSSTPPRT